MKMIHGQPGPGARGAMVCAALVALLAALGQACAPARGDGAAEPPGSSAKPRGTCRQACARLAALGCPEGQSTPGGGTCEAVCTNVQESGVVEWNLHCRANIESCAAVDACEH